MNEHIMTDSPSDKIRLQKLLAEMGYCSRREAEEWIDAGLITVNGKTATLGTKVTYTDAITVNGKPIKRKKLKDKIALALNKPRGVLCSHSDPHHEHTPTVFSILPKKYAHYRLICAGRLDRDSQGLLILTNDGELSQMLTHPSHAITKKYLVTLTEDYDPAIIKELLSGVKEGGELLKAVRVIPIKRGPKATRQLEVHLQEGRNRQIRRMFIALGHHLHRLKRIQIGKFNISKLGSRPLIELEARDIALLLSNH
jgi:23S rRNA pseudouridine2605 synthase